MTKRHIYDEDNISSLPRVGNKTKTHQVISQHSVTTIGELKTLLPDQLPPPPPIRGIEGMHQNATNHSLPGHSPNRVVDHRQADNPYQWVVLPFHLLDQFQIW